MLACVYSEARSQDEEEDEDIMQSDDGAHSWLQDLGLDKSQFRSLDPNKVKLYPSYCQCSYYRHNVVFLTSCTPKCVLMNHVKKYLQCYV